MSSFPGVFLFKTVQGQGPNAPVISASFGINPWGSCYFVHASLGNDTNNGLTPGSPLATLDRALVLAVAGDTIIVAEGYTETLTAVKTISTAGLKIIGLGSRTRRPTLTVNAAADGISLAAAGITFDGFHFAAPGTDEATAMINVAAAGCAIRNITGIGSGSSKNFVDCITLASGADDLLIENVRLWNTNTAVNSFLSIEAAIARLTILNFFAFGDVATAGIIDGAAATQMYWRGVTVGVVGTTKPAATLDSNPTGLIENSRFSGTHATLATNAALGNAIRLFDVLVLEETDGSKQGAQIPAVDTE